MAPKPDLAPPNAEQALETIMTDPRAAVAIAEAAYVAARAAHDTAAAAAALRAKGLAARALHDAAAAAAELRHAIRIARRHGHAVIEAEARMSHALVLDDLGRPRTALREIDRACAQLRGLRLARATMQRALILRRLGRDADALAGYRKALGTFRRHHDRLWMGRVLVNRGVLHSLHGDLRHARADFDAAGGLFAALDMPAAVAQVQHNIGFLAAQAGDVPAALHWYDMAHAYLRQHGDDAVGLLDRAELLLSARLLPEARAAVDAAIDACRRGHLRALLGQAQLLAARVDLASGAAERAGAAASMAARTFRRRDRLVLATLARRVAAGARVAAGQADRRTLRALEQAGDALAAASWLPQAWDAWIDAWLLAIRLDDPEAAARLRLKADQARRGGPASLRVRAAHARALGDLAAGRIGAAKRTAALGYRDFERHQASLGTTELGLRGSGDGADIAGLRVRLALREGRPREALHWLERQRGSSLRLPPARPSDDAAIEARLIDLRRIGAELAGVPDGAHRARALLRRQRVIEAEVRRLSWQVRGDGQAMLTRQPDPAEVVAALGDRALVELFALDGVLHALVVAGGVVRHRTLGEVAATGRELAALRFGIQRLIYRHGSPASRHAARVSVRYSRDALDRMLLAPLARDLGDRDLVIAPTGALHALPWPMLERCRGRALSVVPSSWMWWRAARDSTAGSDAAGLAGTAGAVVLVAGPALEHAHGEVEAIAARMPAARVLTGEAAGVAVVVAALDGIASAHIACHGVFRADNPQFSHLRMADGPLTVYDLSALRRPPGLLTLSACETGLSTVHPGDELQGLAAALLGLGTRAVVASLGPVDDATTRALMVDFHDRVRVGLPPARALAAAQAAITAGLGAVGDRDGDMEPGVEVSALSFVCMGAG